MVKVVQNSFTGGRLDRQMLGRQDFQLYGRGASELVNFNIQRRGCITKRPGFDRLIDLKARFGITENDKVRLVPFAYKKEHGFILIFAKGKCWAVATVPGTIYKAWTVETPNSAATWYQSGDEELEFDYCQCGYRLYMAHQNHPPTVIKAKWSDLDAALAGTTEASPFVWEVIDFAAGKTGYPQITGFLQTRVPPTADTCGGVVTEKYRVSAVFDGVETVASKEAYDTSIIAPVSLGTDSAGNEVVQRSVSSSTTTVDGDTSDTTDTTDVVSQKRKSVTCEGTSYYSPWVDGQTIKLSIKAQQKEIDGVLRWPDQIRIYKKAFGYYGLIGTAGTADEATAWERVETNAAAPSPSQYSTTAPDDPYEVASDKSDKRKFSAEREFLLPYYESDSLDSVLSNSGREWRSDSNGKLTITPKAGEGYLKAGAKNKVKLRLGRYERTFTSFADSNYRRPQKVKFEYMPNTCASATVTLTYTYLDNGERSASTTATATITGLNKGGFTQLRDYYASLDGEGNRHEDALYKAANVWNVSSTLSSSCRSSGDVSRNPSPAAGYWVEIRFALGQDLAAIENRVAYLENVFLRELNSDRATHAPGQGSVEFKLDADTFAGLEGKEGIEISKIEIAPVAPVSGVNTLVLNGVSYSGGVTTSEITFTDNYITPDTSITPLEDEEEELFATPGNYPACVCVSQQRLIWASTKNKPETIWASAIGDFTQYTAHEVGKQDDAMEFDLPVTRFAKLNHLVEMRQLIAFNDACEWVIGSASANAGMSGETVQARPQSYVGSAQHLKPLVCNNAVLFCERTGQAVRRFAYDLANDGFAGKDVSILSCGIFAKNKIVDWCYQQFPNSTVWCVLADGTMASLVYMEEQDVIAWATHRLHDGVEFRAIGTSWAVSPFLDEIQSDDAQAKALADTQEVFCVINYYGNMYLERMRPHCKANDSIYHALTLDHMRKITAKWSFYNDTTHAADHEAGYLRYGGVMQHFTANGEPIDPIEDEPHPSKDDYIDEHGDFDEAGYEAAVNGWKKSDSDALNGYIDRDGYIYEGVPVECDMTSVYPVVGMGIGTGQTDLKDITNVALRLEASSGGEVSAATHSDRPSSGAVFEPIRYDDDEDYKKHKVVTSTRPTNPPSGTETTPFSGNSVPTEATVALKDCDAANMKPFGVNGRDGRVRIRQGEPWPFTLVSMEVDYATEAEGGQANG